MGMIMIKFWEEFFRKVFGEIKNYFKVRYPVDEEEISPSTLALKRLINSLPCHVDIIELRLNPFKYEIIEDEICQLIKYDFSKLGSLLVKYHGIVDADDLQELSQSIVRSFGFTNGKAEKFVTKLYQDFTTIEYDEDKPDVYIQFYPYNIANNSERFLRDLISLFSPLGLPESIVWMFKEPEIDYNSLYELKEDPILSLDEMIALAESKPYPRRSIEDLQKDVSKVQLIPTVPEPVQRVFKCAKDLYVFGYFKYNFFTVSQHYAFLALESAIRHRYNKWLGEKAILTNKKGEIIIEMSQPSYQNIRKLCLRRKKENKKDWHPSNIKVNGEPFPWKYGLLLDWLARHEIIKRWEMRLLKTGIDLRNSLSHLEFTPISTPNVNILKRVADQINSLFHEKNSINSA